MSSFGGTRTGPSKVGCDVCAAATAAYLCEEYQCNVYFCETCEPIRDSLPWANYPHEVFAQVERVVDEFGEAARPRVERVATRLATCEWARYRDSRNR
jgi:hypothetical protein